MRSETDLRDGLVELAEVARPAEGYEATVFRQVRRIRARRRAASVSAGAVVVALVAVAFRLAGIGSTPHLVATPPDGPFLGWTAIGESVDKGLIDKAEQGWNQGAAGPHTGVRALAATRDQLLGGVVILEGYDRQGIPRLAFFTSDAGVLALRADRPAPDPVTTQLISLVSPRLTGPVGQASSDYWGTYAIALAEPGVTRLQVSSTTIDETLRAGGGPPNGRFVVQQLPISSTAQTTSILAFVESKRVFTVAGDGGAIGDARAVQADVVRRSAQQLTVAVDDDQAVRPGQLAVVAAGLVGKVVAVDHAGHEATIELITSSGFSGAAHTDISDVPGTLRGDGTKLSLEDIPTGAKDEVNQGNRILLPDPSQGGGAAGAVTVGRAQHSKPADATSVQLTPTANLDHLRRVSIMTPYSGE